MKWNSIRTVAGEDLTPDHAWEGYVGSQTPAEFLENSESADPYEAATAYVTIMIEDRIFGEDTPDLDEAGRDTLAKLLAGYIELYMAANA